MAICGRCGQTESASEDCPYCSERALAISLVGAYSGAASRASHDVADRPGEDHYRFQYRQGEPPFAALPPCERPFAAERTVWPAAAELAATPADFGARVDDLAIGEHEECDPEYLDVEDVAAEQGHGRWIALTAAILVVLMSAAAAVTLVVQHGRASQSAAKARPSVTARRPVSRPAIVAPAGQNQLIVDPAAAEAPNEAAVVALLDGYFGAVSNHEFADYKRLFIRALRPGLSSASFSADLGTTTDSAEHLHGISVIGGAEVDASVTFISRQPTLGGRRSSTCTAWRGVLHLGWRGTRYLLVAAPRWYQAPDGSCP